MFCGTSQCTPVQIATPIQPFYGTGVQSRDMQTEHSAAYHGLTEHEIKRIRQLLLDWYDTNRRKLPWRGDAPPYGSVSCGNQKKKKKKHETRSSIRAFFTSTHKHVPKTQGKQTPPPPQQSPPAQTKTMLVSPYSVWGEWCVCVRACGLTPNAKCRR